MLASEEDQAEERKITHDGSRRDVALRRLVVDAVLGARGVGDAAKDVRGDDVGIRTSLDRNVVSVGVHQLAFRSRSPNTRTP